jgi:hypothetical protein
LQWGNIGGSINNQADLKNALAGKIPTTEKGAVNGVATLGADGKLTSTQIPAIRVSDVFVVSSQAEMLALGADEGDVAKRTDLGKSYILQNDLPSVLSSWLPMVDDFEPLGAVSDHNASETAHSTLFGGKVDKIDGKGLSTNDYTNEEQTKLAGIEAGAEANIQSDYADNDPTHDAYIKNKPALFSGDYGDLTNKPTIPSDVSELTDTTNLIPSPTEVANKADKVVSAVSGNLASLDEYGNLADSGVSVESLGGYTHEQTTASAEWNITHNLNKHPSCTIVDSAETEVQGELEYINNNSLKLTFIGAFAGKAYLN